MTYALAMVLLVLLWAAITDAFTLPNIVLGAVLAGLALYLLRARAGRPRGLRKLRAWMTLFGLFLRELLLSALAVAGQVIRPRLDLKPAVVAVPLDVQSDIGITLLANLITLTPGTLSVDVAEDRSVLYVHVLDLRDRAALVESIKTGFEARVWEALA